MNINDVSRLNYENKGLKEALNKLTIEYNDYRNECDEIFKEYEETIQLLSDSLNNIKIENSKYNKEKEEIKKDNERIIKELEKSRGKNKEKIRELEKDNVLKDDYDGNGNGVSELEETHHMDGNENSNDSENIVSEEKDAPKLIRPILIW